MFVHVRWVEAPRGARCTPSSYIQDQNPHPQRSLSKKRTKNQASHPVIPMQTFGVARTQCSQCHARIMTRVEAMEQILCFIQERNRSETRRKTHFTHSRTYVLVHCNLFLVCVHRLCSTKKYISRGWRLTPIITFPTHSHLHCTYCSIGFERAQSAPWHLQ